MSKSVFTGAFVLDETAKDFCSAYIAMRHAAEWAKGSYNPEDFPKWGQEERERANARLAALGKREHPEQVAADLAAGIRQIETEIRVNDILDKLVNDAPDKGK
jgi:hypothetical protein